MTWKSAHSKELTVSFKLGNPPRNGGLNGFVSTFADPERVCLSAIDAKPLCTLEFIVTSFLNFLCAHNFATQCAPRAFLRWAPCKREAHSAGNESGLEGQHVDKLAEDLERTEESNSDTESDWQGASPLVVHVRELGAKEEAKGQR